MVDLRKTDKTSTSRTRSKSTNLRKSTQSTSPGFYKQQSSSPDEIAPANNLQRGKLIQKGRPRKQPLPVSDDEEDRENVMKLSDDSDSDTWAPLVKRNKPVASGDDKSFEENDMTSSEIDVALTTSSASADLINSADAPEVPAKRFCFTKKQREFLREKFDTNRRPSKEEMIKWADNFGTPRETIRKWFKNERAKNKKTVFLSLDEATPILEALWAKDPSFTKYHSLELKDQLGWHGSDVENWFNSKRDPNMPFDGPVKVQSTWFTAEQYQFLHDKFEINRRPTKKEMDAWGKNMRVPEGRVRKWFECRRNKIRLPRLSLEDATPILRECLEKDPQFTKYQNAELRDKLGWLWTEVRDWFVKARGELLLSNDDQEQPSPGSAPEDSGDQSEYCGRREDSDTNFHMDDDFDVDFGVGGALTVPREPVPKKVQSDQIAQNQCPTNDVGHARVNAPDVFHDVAAPAILRQGFPVVDEEVYDVDDLQNSNRQMIYEDFDTNPSHAPDPVIVEQFTPSRHYEEHVSVDSVDQENERRYSKFNWRNHYPHLSHEQLIFLEDIFSTTPFLTTKEAGKIENNFKLSSNKIFCWIKEHREKVVASYIKGEIQFDDLPAQMRTLEEGIKGEKSFLDVKNATNLPTHTVTTYYRMRRELNDMYRVADCMEQVAPSSTNSVPGTSISVSQRGSPETDENAINDSINDINDLRGRTLERNADVNDDSPQLLEPVTVQQLPLSRDHHVSAAVPVQNYHGLEVDLEDQKHVAPIPVFQQSLPVMDEEAHDLQDLHREMIHEIPPEPVVVEGFNTASHHVALHEVPDMIGPTPDNQRSRAELHEERTRKFGEWFRTTPLPFNNNFDWSTWTCQEVLEFGCQFLNPEAMINLSIGEIGGIELARFHAGDMNLLNAFHVTMEEAINIQRFLANMDYYMNVAR